jgi:succinate dehydrogenase / fumarate reductase cytochrome b subunit
MSNPDRPLSPHLSIYRWPITMAASILHRATGIAMAVGLIVLASWLVNAAAGPDDYLAFQYSMSTLPGRLLLIGWSLAFFYHLSNGIRHLFWDAGKGFERAQANRSTWIVFASAAVLTSLFWWGLS